MNAHVPIVGMKLGPPARGGGGGGGKESKEEQGIFLNYFTEVSLK